MVDQPKVISPYEMGEELVKLGTFLKSFHGVSETLSEENLAHIIANGPISRKALNKLAEAVGSLQNTKEDAVPQDRRNTQFENDVEWFHEHRHELVPQYQNRYVAVLQGTVVDHDSVFEALAERIYAKYGYRDFVMQKVEANPRPHRIMSPRVVRS